MTLYSFARRSFVHSFIEICDQQGSILQNYTDSRLIHTTLRICCNLWRMVGFLQGDKKFSISATVAIHCNWQRLWPVVSCRSHWLSQRARSLRKIFYFSRNKLRHLLVAADLQLVWSLRLVYISRGSLQCRRDRKISISLQKCGGRSQQICSVVWTSLKACLE